MLSKFEPCLDFHNVLCPFTEIFARVLPSKYLLVLKTSWRCLHHIFSVTILRLSRHLEDVYWRGMTKANIFVLIKPSQRRLLKTKTKNVIKTSSSRRIFAGYIAFLKIYPGYRIYTTKGATILGDLGNNMKDRLSFQSNE